MTTENKIELEYALNKYSSKATLAQMLATIAHSFLFIELGMCLFMPTIVIRDLYRDTTGEFSLTTAEVSWYSSLLFIIHPFGCILSGILQDKYGKKICMMFANIPNFIGWILLYYAHSSCSLNASILLTGLSTGFGAGSTSSYVGEIAEPRLRGSFSSLGISGLGFGVLIMSVMGFYFDWRTVALLSTLCPLICIWLVIFIPESPIWLVTKRKNEQAERSLCWLRGWVQPKVVKRELLQIIHYNEVSGTLGEKFNDNNNSFFSKLAEFKDPSIYRPLKLMIVYFFVAYICSIFPARPFITKVMTNVGLYENQNEFLIMYTGLAFFGSILSTIFVHRVGKRFLTLLTLTINTTLLFSFGTYVIAVKNNYIDPFPWTVVVILCGIYFFGSCGISSVTWMLLIEVFPNKKRGIATSMCSGLSYIGLFVLVKLYLTVEKMLSLEYTMILFGCIGVYGLCYFYLYLPETENKTLLEIEAFFILDSKTGDGNKFNRNFQSVLK